MPKKIEGDKRHLIAINKEIRRLKKEAEEISIESVLIEEVATLNVKINGTLEALEMLIMELAD